MTSTTHLSHKQPRSHFAADYRMPALVSALAALLVFACTLRGTYVYDDDSVLQKDPRISHPALWGQFWTKAYTRSPDKLYRPLTSMTFAVQYWINGDRPWAFHLVNILLHAAVAAAVAELGRRLAGMRVGLIAGLFFAVHPVHVEAVAGIVGRSELMCALATLIGLCIYLGGPLSRPRVLRLGICCVAAILSKEQGMLFPGMLLVIAPFRRTVIDTTAERAYRLPLIALLIYILASYFLFREYTIGFWWDRRFLEWAVNPLVRSHGADKLLMPIVLAGRYLSLLLFPVRQSIDYGGYVIGWHASFSDPYLYLGIAAMVGWVAIFVWSLFYRRWAIFFCAMGFALTYGMVGNIVAMIGTIMADRLMYLPSVFVVILLAIACRDASRRFVGPAVIVLVLLGGFRTVRYARLWNSPMALAQECLRIQPRSERVYALLFAEYRARGDWAGARRVAADAVAAVPDSDQPYEMCAEADLAVGDIEDANRMIDKGMSACTGDDRLYLVMWRQGMPEVRPQRKHTIGEDGP